MALTSDFLVIANKVEDMVRCDLCVTWVQGPDKARNSQGKNGLLNDQY